MKRLIRLFYLAMVVTVLGSCARDRVIPDDELARIFRDAYLINAYVSDQGLKIDSLELYEPVFNRYGYTAEDVRYTIGNFSRRKSAKLSDVVEQSIQLLEKESAYYKYEVSVLDTIDNVARRRFTRTIYTDSLIRVNRLKDTARLRLRIPNVRPGEYRVSFDYLIDSLDENFGPRMQIWFEGADSSRLNDYSITLRKQNRESFSKPMQADTSARALAISLYGSRERLKRPHITVYDLKISHIPETKDAVDSLYIEQLGLKIFADEFFDVLTPDSLQLPLHGDEAR